MRAKIYGWCRQRRSAGSRCPGCDPRGADQAGAEIADFAYDPRKGSFRGWLKTVTHRAWCDYLESRQRAGLAGESKEVLQCMETLEARDDLLKTLAETFDLGGSIRRDPGPRAIAGHASRLADLHPYLWKDGPVPRWPRNSGMTVTAVLMAREFVYQKKLLSRGSSPQCWA